MDRKIHERDHISAMSLQRQQPRSDLFSSPSVSHYFQGTVKGNAAHTIALAEQAVGHYLLYSSPSPSSKRCSSRHNVRSAAQVVFLDLFLVLNTVKKNWRNLPNVKIPKEWKVGREQRLTRKRMLMLCFETALSILCSSYLSSTTTSSPR